MTIDFYYMPASAPCRSVMMTAKALGVELNLIQVDLQKGEHLKPEFIKINPQHTIPTLNDNGFIVWESRAIMGYLVTQYGKDDSLYPKDAKKRALVDQRLYFDAGTLYQRYSDYYYPVFFGGQPEPAKYEKLEHAFDFLNTFLSKEKWAAGSNWTIADLALVASVTTAEASEFPVSKYPKVQEWLDRVKKEVPVYKINSDGIVVMNEMMAALRAKK